MKNVAVICTDKNYINHAKSLIAGLIKHGEWADDIIVITDEKDIESFKCFDFIAKIRQIEKREHPFFMKTDMLEPFYEQWDNILYLDCDCMVMRPIVLDNLCSNPKNITIVGDYTEFTLHQCLTCNMKTITPEQQRLLTELDSKLPLSKNAFNAGCLLLGTKYIRESQLKRRFNELREMYKDINYHIRGIPDGSEEPIWNLATYHQAENVKNNQISFWKRNQETATILHFCHWDAPWQNPKYFGQYSDNLRAFNFNEELQGKQQ